MKPLIIGIAGGSGSGKSTFAAAIANRFSHKKVFVINMDKFYKNPLPQIKSPVTGDIFDDYNHPSAIDFEKPLGMLVGMQSGNLYDIIVVEGAFLLCYDEMRELFDLKIFIDLDADERMYRRVRRNTDNFKKDNIDFQFEYYLHFAKYQEKKFTLPSKIYADIILNGKTMDGSAGEVVFSWIEAKTRD